MNHWPSDRIGRESMKKRKAETCVLEQGRKGLFGKFFYPGCNSPGIWYDAPKTCPCGKRVEVKR